MRSMTLNPRLLGPAATLATILLFATRLAAAEPPPALSATGPEVLQLVGDHAFVAAYEAARDLVEHHPDDPDAAALLGVAAVRLGRFDEARPLLERALGARPEHPEAHLALGMIDSALNRYAAAAEHFRQAMRSEHLAESACRGAARAFIDQGRIDAAARVFRDLADRIEADGGALPEWLTSSLAGWEDLPSDRVYLMPADFEALSIPLLDGPHGLQMIELRLNGAGSYPFDIDTAAPDVLIISPLLAEELGVLASSTPTAGSVGVGQAPIESRYAWLEKIEIGGLEMRNLPVLVLDSRTFRGQKKGLIGTGLLKRFNCTIDRAAGVLTLYPLQRADLLHDSIAPDRVTLRAPLLVLSCALIEVRIGDGPPALFIVDSASGAQLLDPDYFERHLADRIDSTHTQPQRTTGAGGVEESKRLSGLGIRSGEQTLPAQDFVLLPMRRFNEIAERYAAGLLGNPFLGRGRIHLDFHNSLLVLEDVAVRAPAAGGAIDGPQASP